MLKKIKLHDAVGMELAHDITEIRPNEFKGPVFRKGHMVCNDDLCHLEKLGKNSLYQIELEADEIHENQAAAMLAEALAGEGITWENNPQEGKIKLFAGKNGMLVINTSALSRFNMVDEVMCATLHNHTRVKKGELVAATRAIPLVMKRKAIEEAATIAREHGATIDILPLRQAKTGIIITGNEVYHGLIEDRFAPILTEKVIEMGSLVENIAFVPDDTHIISDAIRSQITHGCDLILLSGGMSVDPDDVTRLGIQQAGATEVYYGAAVLPGAMFLVAYIDGIPLLGTPACALYHKTTVLDIVLPRILAGEHVDKTTLAALGHGGLCMDCAKCNYPHCPFGKGS